MKALYLLSAMLLILFCPVRGQNSLSSVAGGNLPAGELDTLISNRWEGVAPGCVVLGAAKGQILYEKAFGSANLEQYVSMRPDMVFRIGSIPKQYTAMAILQLVEQGKIVL